MRPQAGIDRLKPVPPMRAKDLPVVGQALSPGAFACQPHYFSPSQRGVAGKRCEMAKSDCLYVGRGSQSVSFSSDAAANPACFYLLSYAAHAAYPTTLIPSANANHVHLGTAADANRRTIHQYIHSGGVKSCQLVMGYTQLHEGSVWNTMPPHTHARRTEIYVYFDLGKGRVMHFMGTPEETRHIAISDRQAVI